MGPDIHRKNIPTPKEWQDIQYSTLRRSRRTEATKQRVTGGLPSGGCNTSMALICCCLIIFTMTLFLFFWYICHPVLLITCAQGSESFGSDAFWMFWPELFRQNMLHLNNKFYGEAPEFLNPLNISFDQVLLYEFIMFWDQLSKNLDIFKSYEPNMRSAICLFSSMSSQAPSRTPASTDLHLWAHNWH